MKTKVLLVDDHTMFREALHIMLDREPQLCVVGELGDAALIEETVARLQPDVVVMDVSMPGVNGIEATRTLKAKYPKLKVVALSAYSYKQFVMEMLDAGAIAYVVKSAAGELLVHAIASAAAGETYLCPEATAILVESSRLGGKGGTAKQESILLGRRETQVLRLLALGQSSPQIGESLHIATSTVDVHRRNIMNKLELHTVAALTTYALRTGLTEM
jgi:two-component system NarL family response regulator